MNPIIRSAAQPVLAASILLVRDAPLQVLMVRRGATAVFASALVFPGGVVDSDDASEDWLPYVTGAGALGSFERSLRIASCRELFEETGVFVGAGAAPIALDAGRSFFDEVKAHRATLALDRLVPFGHWITPDGVGKRFDTYFFLCEAPRAVHARADGYEVVTVKWARPREVIDLAHDSTANIMFPTLMNLTRLAESPDVHAAIATAASRPPFTVLPRIECRGGTTYVVIPAAAGYGVTEAELPGHFESPKGA